ncbi:MAG: LysR family transcriptional regulator substrate-binding protein, partial [Synergistaceae bacterium]|nr:LysR family transcriptional regulator substrate-binding protein [Synergistaceae bacterium]
GKIYIASIGKILAAEEEMNAQIRDIDGLKSGSLCIGGSHFINTCILPEIMTEYSRRYPGIKLELLEASSAFLVDMLTERLIDITFTCRDDIIAQFTHYPAFNDHILLAVSSEILSLEYALSADDVISGKHLQPECPCIPFEAMNELEYVILSEGNNLHDRAMMIFNEAGISPKIKLEISQLSTSYHLAGAKFGAAFVSDKMINSNENGLSFYRIDSPVTERLFYTVLPKREYTPKAVRAFSELLRP